MKKYQFVIILFQPRLKRRRSKKNQQKKKKSKIDVIVDDDGDTRIEYDEDYQTKLLDHTVQWFFEVL